MDNYYQTQTQTKVCGQCGNPMSVNATICSICGAGRVPPKNKWEQRFSNIKPVEDKHEPRSRIILILLSFIGFGLGYFYLGYQDKFISRVSLFVKSFIYIVTLVAAVVGVPMLFWFMVLHLYDWVYLIFIVKYDAYGNRIKFI